VCEEEGGVREEGGERGGGMGGGEEERARKEKRRKERERIYDEECARKKEVRETTSTPHNNDVLCGNGREGTLNAHPGNEHFQKLVDQEKRLYLTARSIHEKRLILSKIVDEIRNLNPPGRFLLKDANSNLWRDIGDERAHNKTSNSLRKNALAVRRQLEDDFEKSQLKQAQAANVAT
jgi:hypothetical protein